MTGIWTNAYKVFISVVPVFELIELAKQGNV